MSDKYTETAVCPKCGGKHIATRYEYQFGNEWLLRKCDRCGYAWKQTPLDKEPAQ